GAMDARSYHAASANGARLYAARRARTALGPVAPGSGPLRADRGPRARSRRAALLPGHRPRLLPVQAVHRGSTARRKVAVLGSVDRIGDAHPRADDARGPAPLHPALPAAALRAGLQAEPPARPAA